MVSYYKKQVEVARQFGVSEATITNWIKNAGQGSNNIQIEVINGSKYIVKNEHNRVEMEKMAQNARKYRSDESEKDVVASPELYEIMEENQLVSLINSIAIRKEIPLKYRFLGKGAKYWQDFYLEAINDPNYTYSTSSSDIFLLESLYNHIKNYIDHCDYFNIVDLGCGNASPLLGFIEKSLNTKKLKKYLAIDISKTMLEISEKNLQSNIKKSIFNGFHLDFETNSLEDVLYKYKLIDGVKGKVINLIFFVGSTIGNMGGINQQVKVLQNIRDGMGPEDILIISNAYDTITNRTHFPKFMIHNADKQELYIPKLLGINDEDISKDLKYDESKHLREYNLVLNKNINIHFDKLNLDVELKKGDKLNVWKHKRDTFEFISEKMERSGLSLEFVIKNPNDAKVMYMARVAE